MPDIDSLLQERLAALEAGQPLDTLLADLPEEQQREMEALLRLATALRDMPHPLPIEGQVASQRAQIMAAAEIHTQPLPLPELPQAGPQTYPTLPRQPAQKPLPAERKRPGWLWGGSLAFGAAAAVLLCLGMVFILSLNQAFGQDGALARLEDVRGQVQMASGVDSENWQAVEKGDSILAGQRLRTQDASSVTLAFPDGTRTFVGARSELTLTTLLTGSSNRLRIELSQSQGQTYHNVVPLKGIGSYFRVTTPAGRASVHGTRFGVRVSPDGQSLFLVNTGEVRVRNQYSEVRLLPGQTTASEPGQPPARPAYQFNAQGSLLDNEGMIWAVSGATFEIGAQTHIDDDLQLGESVVVSGRVLNDSTRLADRVERTVDLNQATIFTGTLQSMQDDTWLVNGIPLNITDQTQLADGLSAGELVRVTANILNNGNWLALKIDSLDQEAREPAPPARVTPTASITPTAGSIPAAGITPDADSTPDAGSPTSVPPSATPAVTAPLKPSEAAKADDANACPGAELHPTGQTLAQRYDVPYETIMTWFCRNYGFGEIDLAYSLSQRSGRTVDEVFALHASGSSWGELKQQLAPDNNEKPDKNDKNDSKDKNDEGNPDKKGNDRKDNKKPPKGRP
jgi:ferric-dicitrate binding protein FerR (iron transport regulator)